MAQIKQCAPKEVGPLKAYDDPNQEKNVRWVSILDIYALSNIYLINLSLNFGIYIVLHSKL